MSSAPPIGLDFGSQTCRAYVWKNGRAQMVSGSTFASAVSLSDHLMYGREAVKELDTRHCNSIRHVCASMMVKRPMIMEHPSSGLREFEIDEYAAFLLDAQRRGASKLLGTEVTRACVALPSAMNVIEKTRLVAASCAAGFSSFEAISSPVVGAIYWAHCARVLGSPDIKRDLFVVDVGCRFASVSVIRLDCGPTPKDITIEVLASKGLRDGGYSVDLALSSMLETAIGSIHDIQILNAAEKAKKELSSLKETNIQVKEHKKLINRGDLDVASEGFVASLKALMRSVLVSFPNLSLAVLIGGASRMTAIQNFIKNTFKLSVDIVDSDYAAVMGTAIFANSAADLTFEITERQRCYEYWICSVDRKEFRQIFVSDYSEYLSDKTNQGGWWVFQRLKGSAPLPDPSKDDFVVSALKPRGDPTYSRARTDGIPDDENDTCADTCRNPSMVLPTPPPVTTKQLFLRREPNEPIGLQLRKIESRIIILEVKPDSASAKQGFERYSGWILTHAQGIPIHEIKELQSECSGKTDVSLTVRAPADWSIKRDMEFIGTCDSGMLILQSSGLIKGLNVPVPPVMDDIRIEEVRTMLASDCERRVQMQHFSEVRNDLDEVIIRSDEDLHPSQLNKYSNKGEELLMLAGFMLEHTTVLSRKKRLAKLQLAKMHSLSKLLLRILDLHELGKGVGDAKVKEFESEFWKASQHLDEYESNDEYDDKPKKLKKMLSTKKTLKRKSNGRQSSGSPVFNKTYVAGGGAKNGKLTRGVESVYYKKSFSPERETIPRSLSSNGLMGRYKPDPTSPLNKEAIALRKAAIDELRAASRNLDTYKSLSPVPRANTGVFNSPMRPASPGLVPMASSPRLSAISPKVSPKRFPMPSPKAGKKKKKRSKSKKPHTFENIDSDTASTLEIDDDEFTSDDVGSDDVVRLSGIPITTSVFRPSSLAEGSPPRSPTKRLSHGVPQSVKDALSRARKASDPASPVAGMMRKRSSTLGAYTRNKSEQDLIEGIGSQKNSISVSPTKSEMVDFPKRPPSRFSSQRQRPPLPPSLSGSPKPSDDSPDGEREKNDRDKPISKPLSRSIKGSSRGLPSLIDINTPLAGLDSVIRVDSISSAQTRHSTKSLSSDREMFEKQRQEADRIARELLNLEVRFERQGREKLCILEDINWDKMDKQMQDEGTDVQRKKEREARAEEERLRIEREKQEEERLDREAQEREKQKEREKEELEEVQGQEQEARELQSTEEGDLRLDMMEREEEGKETIIACEMLARRKPEPVSLEVEDSSSSAANTSTFASPKEERVTRPRKPSAHIPRVAQISPALVRVPAVIKSDPLGASQHIPRVAQIQAPKTTAPVSKPDLSSSTSSHVPRVAQIKQPTAPTGKSDTFSTPPKVSPKVGGPVAPPSRMQRTGSPLRSSSPLSKRVTPRSRSPLRSPSSPNRQPGFNDLSSSARLNASARLNSSTTSEAKIKSPPSYSISQQGEDKRPPPLEQPDSATASIVSESKTTSPTASSEPPKARPKTARKEFSSRAVQRSKSRPAADERPRQRTGIVYGDKKLASSADTIIVSNDFDPPLRGIVKDSTPKATTPKTLTPKAGKVTIRSTSRGGSSMDLGGTTTTPLTTPNDLPPSARAFGSELTSPASRPSSHPSSRLMTPTDRPLVPTTRTVPAGIKRARRTTSPRVGQRGLADSQIVTPVVDVVGDITMDNLNRTVPCMLRIASEDVTEEHNPPKKVQSSKNLLQREVVLVPKVSTTSTFSKPREHKEDPKTTTPAFRRPKKEKTPVPSAAFNKSLPFDRRSSDDISRRRTLTSTTTVRKQKDGPSLSKGKRTIWNAPSGPVFTGKASSRSATSYVTTSSDFQDTVTSLSLPNTTRRRTAGKSPLRTPESSPRRSLTVSDSPGGKKRSRSAGGPGEEDRDVLIDKLRHQLKSAGLQTSAMVPRS